MYVPCLSISIPTYYGFVGGNVFNYSFFSLFLITAFTLKQVSLSYEDDRPVDGKGIGRRVIDRVTETYESELGGKHFAYDGEKSLFTVGPLPQRKLEFTVVLEDVSSNR